MWISIFWTPCMAKKSFLFTCFFEKKVPKMLHIIKAKFLGDPIFWSQPFILFLHQNMWIFIFWTPCMAEIAFYWFGLSIFEKGSQNAQLQKGKTFQETQYFANVHISHFFHQNMSIFIFWTPCMARIAFHWLGLAIFEKKPPKCSTSERQNFSGDTIFWSCPYI